MAFSCTACSVKPYNKLWLLRRHEKESVPCFKHLFPGEPLPIRFECPECDKFGPEGSARKKDVERHLQRVHEMDPVTAELSVMFTRPTNASRHASTQVDTTATPDLQQIASSSAHQDQLLQSAMKDVMLNECEYPVSGLSAGSGTLPTLHSTPCLQKATPPMIQEGSGEIERIDSHLTSPSSPPAIKRKYSDPRSLSKQCKRLRNRVNLEDPNIPNEIYETRSDDTFTVMANDIREQESDTDVLRDDRTDTIAQKASEVFSGALSLHPRPPSRSQSDPHFETIAIPMETTASHDTPSTEYSHSRHGLPGDMPAITNFTSTVESHEIAPDDEIHIQSSRMSALSISDREVETLPSALFKSVKRQSTSLSSLGFSRSIRTSSSLFGSHASVSRWRHKPLSSHRSAPGVTFKSLHSNGMAGPMLEPVDEELLQSRVGRVIEKARSFAGLSAKSVSSEEYDLKMQAHARKVQLELQENFRKAAEKGDVPGLRKLFSNLEYNCNDRDRDGQTPLLWASERGYRRAVEVLIAEFPEDLDADCLDNNDMTALMYACKRGECDITDALLKLPSINLELQGQEGLTALMMAIRSRKTAVMKKLIAPVKDRPDYLMVRKLLASVEDRPDYATAAQWSQLFDAQDARGLTALHWAAKMGSRLNVSALLDTGKVDVHRKAYTGITVAMQAVYDGNLDLVTLLLERKACDPTLTNDAGRSILSLAECNVGNATCEVRDIGFCTDGDDEEVVLPLRKELSEAKQILRVVKEYVEQCQTARCSY
jgi:ankyrin repeat protein